MIPAITIPETMRGAKILIVDDMAVSRRILERTFIDCGMLNLREARGGREALSVIAEWEPDIVLLDLTMPDMDGEAVCKALQSTMFQTKPVIIVQSGLTQPEYKRRLFNLGVTDYITKPLDPGELIVRCLSHLERRMAMQDLKLHQERINGTLQEAALLQSTIMPRPAELLALEQRYGVEVAGHYRPSELIGGDFWDVRPVDERRFAVCMADFSGHGLLAAFRTFRLHTMLNETHAADDPSQILESLGASMYRLFQPGQFATMLYAVIDVQAHSMSIANAGALPPMIMAGDGSVSNSAVKGVPLGCMASARYDSVTLPFSPGDMLLFMSDGLAECPGTGDDTLDYGILPQMMQDAQKKGGSAQEALKQIVYACNSYPARTTLSDDETAVLITYRNALLPH